MKTVDIQYCFTLADGLQEVFDVKLNARDLSMLRDSQQKLPSWTQLGFHKCSNCPLSNRDHQVCPMAAGLVNIVYRFDGLKSYDDIRVKVVTEERIIIQDTTAQRGISSLMGLVMATSGCPHTVFFRPMARFHLPLASENETIFRATSMYMLAQYFKTKKGQRADLKFKGLTEIYRNIHIVNTAISERLRAASESDSAVNAVILLDMYAKALPYVIEESLEEIRHLFTPYVMKHESYKIESQKG